MRKSYFQGCTWKMKDLMWIYLKILTNWLKISEIYCRRKIVNDSWNCEATLLQSLSKNLVEFYCKILIFWKSFLDFNNVSYGFVWWSSWLSKLRTRHQLLIYFCNFSSQDKCLSISAEVTAEVINSKCLTRSPTKTLLKKAWRTPVNSKKPF